jgi:hypothetical protein
VNAKFGHYYQLTAEERKQFSSRLLELHKVISESEDENYTHNVFSRNASNSCGTAACAVGHALWHIKRFPGLEHHKLSFTSVVNGAKFGLIRPEGANAYFGPRAWENIFDLLAYDKPPNEVTRADALRHIERQITEVYGCTLIEERIE